jgi:hypothetical protein
MINTMKKSLVLAAAIAALSAMTVPSMASANNWVPVGTVHILNSPSSIAFNIQGFGTPLGFSCASGPTFNGQVRTPTSPLMDLTSTTTNIPCTGTGWIAGCNVTLDMIGLPLWNADGTSTTNVKINSVNIQGKQSGGPCGAGTNFTVTGQLAGGVWSNLNRTLAFTNGTGLTYTLAGTGYPVTVTASEFIKDTTSPFVGL